MVYTNEYCKNLSTKILDAYKKLESGNEYPKTEFKFNNTEENYDFLADSFKRNSIELKPCTFRKLFVPGYPKNFASTTIEKFEKYIQKAESQVQPLLPELEKEYKKWQNTNQSPIIEHHHLMSLKKFRKIIPIVLSDLSKIQKKHLRYVFINSVYFGDYSMHVLKKEFRDDYLLIDYMVRYIKSSLIRVGWRSAYILSTLNTELVIIKIEKLESGTSEFSVPIDDIKNKTVERFLEKLIESGDPNLTFYARQVLKQIRYKI